MFLRFPGQWDDATWAESGEGGEIVYNVYRWYGTETGRYGRVDPLVSQISILFAQGLLIGDPGSPYNYSLQRPLVLTDPLGLLSNDPNGCVTRWIALGAATGAGLGAAAGGLAGGAGSGATCTFVAPGVGTIGCAAAGGSAGAAGGAKVGGATGALVGGLIGTLVCQCEDAPPLFRPESKDIDCRKVRSHCIGKCTEETLPTGTLDGAPSSSAYGSVWIALAAKERGREDA